MRRPKRRAEDIIVGLDSVRVGISSQLTHQDILCLNLRIRETCCQPWAATLALRRRRQSSEAGNLHLARRHGAGVAMIVGGKTVQTSARNLSIACCGPACCEVVGDVGTVSASPYCRPPLSAAGRGANAEGATDVAGSESGECSSPATIEPSGPEA
jgi:hypothetical protein